MAAMVQKMKSGTVKAMLFILRHRYLGPTTISLGLSGAYIMYKDWIRYPQMMKAFSSGTILSPLTQEITDGYLPRPDIQSPLSEILKTTPSGRYYLVRGEVGTGKTRTILELVMSMMKSSGEREQGAPVYVLAYQGKNFSDTLAEAVNFHFDEHLNFKHLFQFILGIRSFPGKAEQEKLSRTLNAIEEAADEYRRKHDRSAVIVIDGIEWLVENKPGTLEMLQKKAKLWADTGIAKLVFVTSDEKSEQVLLHNAADWSRAGTPIYFTDLNRASAKEMLTSSRVGDGISSPIFKESEIDTILDTVGGRVLYLLEIRRDRLNGLSLDQSLTRLQAKERTKLNSISKTPSVHLLLYLLQHASDVGIYLQVLAKVISKDEIDCIAAANLIRFERAQKGTLVKFESKLAESAVKNFMDADKCKWDIKKHHRK